MELLLQAQSIADWIIRLIMPSRYTPMTDMLINYQAIRQQVADLQVQLDEDKEELLRSKPATRSSRRPWRR